MIWQERGAPCTLTEVGSILIRHPLDEPTGGHRWVMGGHMVLVQRRRAGAPAAALPFPSMVLDQIDRTERTTDVAVAVSIAGAE